jgi:hypothetical protein
MIRRRISSPARSPSRPGGALGRPAQNADNEQRSRTEPSTVVVHIKHNQISNLRQTTFAGFGSFWTSSLNHEKLVLPY